MNNPEKFHGSEVEDNEHRLKDKLELLKRYASSETTGYFNPEDIIVSIRELIENLRNLDVDISEFVNELNAQLPFATYQFVNRIFRLIRRLLKSKVYTTRSMYVLTQLAENTIAEATRSGLDATSIEKEYAQLLLEIEQLQK